MVLFTAWPDWAELDSRVKKFPKLQPGPQFEYFLVAGSMVGINCDDDVVEDYDEAELRAVSEELGRFKASLIEYENAEVRDIFIREVLRGLRGLLDTNYGEILSYSSTRQWVLDHPLRHFREM
ncbi:hypothetical protein ABZ626_12205 [Streptomyces longispororuber]|uniref:hypothetical protein n=1 Tax=Streptomyces longispororuber TaxID=68230 RepID=UPI0033EC9366